MHTKRKRSSSSFDLVSPFSTVCSLGRLTIIYLRCIFNLSWPALVPENFATRKIIVSVSFRRTPLPLYNVCIRIQLVNRCFSAAGDFVSRLLCFHRYRAKR